MVSVLLLVWVQARLPFCYCVLEQDPPILLPSSKGIAVRISIPPLIEDFFYFEPHPSGNSS